MIWYPELFKLNVPRMFYSFEPWVSEVVSEVKEIGISDNKVVFYACHLVDECFTEISMTGLKSPIDCEQLFLFISRQLEKRWKRRRKIREKRQQLLQQASEQAI